MEQSNFDTIIQNLVELTLNINLLKKSNFNYESIINIINNIYEFNPVHEEKNISNTEISWSNVVKQSCNIKVQDFNKNKPLSLRIPIPFNKYVKKPDFFNEDEKLYQRLFNNANKTNDWKIINTIFDYQCKDMNDLTIKLV